MSMLDNYRFRIEQTKGEALKQRKIKATQKTMDRKFMAFPTAGEFDVLEPNAKKTKKCKLRIIHDLNMKQFNPERRHSVSFIVHPDYSLLQGTVVFDYDEQDWLITSVTNIGEVHQQGLMFRINQTLKWVANGVVKESVATIFPTSYTAQSVVETQVLSVPTESLKISVPSNNETLTLKRDIRFFINDSVYKIKRIDNYTEIGILNLIVAEDLISPKDNVELGIADCDLAPDPVLDPHIKLNETISYGHVRTATIENIGSLLVDSWILSQPKEVLEIVSENEFEIKLKIKQNAKVSGEVHTLTAILSNGVELSTTITSRGLL